MENEISYGKNPPEDSDQVRLAYEKASENWTKYGQLGVTADDHWRIGGSPDEELRKNPGKTLGEIFSIEQITEKLQGYVSFLEKARKEYGGYKNPQMDHESRWSKDNIISAKKSLRLAIPYLKFINKLPKEFENFQVNDLPTDPQESFMKS